MAEPKESKSSKHFRFSIAKSVIRFAGYTFMIFSGVNMIVIAGVLLVAAEVLGIAEEI